MDARFRALHLAYLQAVQAINEHVDAHCRSDDARSAFRVRAVGPDEFTSWWSHVSLDPLLKARWLRRFDDPVRALADEARQIMMDLQMVHSGRGAA